MDSLHIDMQTANRIFTRAQSVEHEGVIGVLRNAAGDKPLFDQGNASATDADDLPVMLGSSSKELDNRDHLKVITDTRGVMQLHAYRCDDGVLSELLINTEN